ncbi:MAG: hypothetical protein H3C46_05315 [Ignavibacteria bacterium]|nr:hypothetical protein [Ignavibacteria bacterium]
MKHLSPSGTPHSEDAQPKRSGRASERKFFTSTLPEESPNPKHFHKKVFCISEKLGEWFFFD